MMSGDPRPYVESGVGSEANRCGRVFDEFVFHTLHRDGLLVRAPQHFARARGSCPVV